MNKVVHFYSVGSTWSNFYELDFNETYHYDIMDSYIRFLYCMNRLGMGFLSELIECLLNKAVRRMFLRLLISMYSSLCSCVRLDNSTRTEYFLQYWY